MLSSASMLPLGALMVGLAGPIVDLIYERGAFDAAAGDLVDDLLMAYGVGMAVYLGRDVLVRVFYALGDGNTPFRLSVAGIGFKAVFDWVLVGGPTPWGLQLPALNFGAPGLVLATVAVNVFTCGALLWVLHRRLGGLPLLAWGRDTLLLLLAALLGGLLAWALANSLAWPQTLAGLVLRPALAGGLGLAVFGLVATATGVPEARQMLTQLGSRIRR